MAASAARRVGVIGAGMVGVCAASWLQRDGHSVFVIDPGDPGEGASFGNAGCLNGSSVDPDVDARGDPQRAALARWTRSDRCRCAGAICRRSCRGSFASCAPARRRRRARRRRALRPLLGPPVACLDPLVRNAGAGHLVEKRGHLVVYRSDAGFAQESRTGTCGAPTASPGTRSARRAAPVRASAVARLRARPLRRRERPHQRSAPPRAGARRSARARRRARSAGRARPGSSSTDASLTSVTDLGPSRRTLRSWRPARSRRRSPRRSATQVPLETERGYHLMIRDPEVMPRIPTTDADGKFVATPMAAAACALPARSSSRGLEAAPDWRRARILWRRAAAHAAARLRPHPRGAHLGVDGSPAEPAGFAAGAGRLARTPDVIYAFGHGHVGMTAAPMTGKIVSDLVAGRDPGIDMAPYRRRPFRLIAGGDHGTSCKLSRSNQSEARLDIEAAPPARRTTAWGIDEVTRQKIVAQFHDYGAAHRALRELTDRRPAEPT